MKDAQSAYTQAQKEYSNTKMLLAQSCRPIAQSQGPVNLNLIKYLRSRAFFFKMAHNLDLRCVLISDPGTLGTPAKNTPQCAQGCDLS